MQPDNCRAARPRLSCHPPPREEEVSDGPFAADWAWRVRACSAAAGQVAVTRVETETGSAGMDKTTQTEDVRFKNEFYERMTVPVSVQGTGPYRFLVDTGADRTAVSRDLVNRLSLAPGNEAFAAQHRRRVGGRDRQCSRSPADQPAGPGRRRASARAFQHGRGRDSSASICFARSESSSISKGRPCRSSRRWHATCPMTGTRSSSRPRGATGGWS